jgi:hypothetical protein
MNLTNIRKITLVGDLHLGIRNNSVEWMNIQRDFLLDFLLTKVDEDFDEDRDILILEGDIFHSRESINVRIQNEAFDIFKQLAKKFKRGIYIIMESSQAPLIRKANHAGSWYKDRPTDNTYHYVNSYNEKNGEQSSMRILKSDFKQFLEDESIEIIKVSKAIEEEILKPMKIYAEGGEIFDKETEDYLSELTKKFAKGGEVVADKTETINMKDFEGYADQYNGRKNKFFKATDEYQLLVNEGMDVKNNKDLPQEEKDKLLAELRDKAREAKSNLNDERKDFVSLREVKSPFYAPQLAKGGMTAKQRIDKGEGGSYKLKTKHQFFPAKGIDVYLHIDSQSMRGTMQFTLGVRNLDVQNPKQVISDVLEKKRLSPSSYQIDVTKESKSIKVKIIFNFLITSDNFTYLSKEILKALTNKEYYQSILDEKKEETPPPTSTPPPTQRKGLPSTDLRVWGAEYEIGDKVKIRWDFSTDLGNGASDVIYDSPENFFEITDKTILSEAKRKENPTGFLYELTNGQTWEGKDLEIIEEQAIPTTEKKDDWTWRFKTEEELKGEYGWERTQDHIKDGNVFATNMSYLFGKKIKETQESVEAIFKINQNKYGGVETLIQKQLGIETPTKDSFESWSISSWMITDKPLQGQQVPPTEDKKYISVKEVEEELMRWTAEKVEEKKGLNSLKYQTSHLLRYILLNQARGKMSDFTQLIAMAKQSEKVNGEMVRLSNEGLPIDGFVMQLMYKKVLQLMEDVKAQIMLFVKYESDVKQELDRLTFHIPYLAELDTFDKDYITHIK